MKDYNILYILVPTIYCNFQVYYISQSQCSLYKDAFKRFIYLYREEYELIVITANNATVVTIENLFLLDNCLKPVKGAVCSCAHSTTSPSNNFVPLFLGTMAPNRLAPLSSNGYRSSRKMSKTCTSRCAWIMPMVG